jgi:CO/xanthine dehydrogenase FAD-binding subunit
MKSNPAEFDVKTPRSLRAVLTVLATNPGEWLPIAGGTDVMVQFAAGTLRKRKFVSVWDLPELRRIEATAGELQIGAASTYTDLRRNEIIASEFPLLACSASWTGGIANQNRGTLGGNIVNASPAADSLPALLAYEAELILISSRGERRIPYLDFHTGYKKMQLAPDELIRAICLPIKYTGYVAYTRKVGGRKAQAISKVAMAALGRLNDRVVDDVRIALGSVAPVPIRLRETEAIIRGKRVNHDTLDAARKAAIAETRPIDDIRSTAKYRAAIVGNLVTEFLLKLGVAAAQS